MTWHLKLPEITYPLSIDTVGMVLATGHDITMYCHECDRKAVRLNLVQIAKRYGVDYSSLAPSLIKVVSCAVCKAEGRPRKNISFSLHPPALHSDWPREG